MAGGRITARRRVCPSCARPSPPASARPAAIKVGPEHVSVVPGGKPIIFFPMLALLEPGDEVIYPNPGFPIYESMINFLGAKPVAMPLAKAAASPSTSSGPAAASPTAPRWSF